VVPGKVSRIDPAAKSGTVLVDVELHGELPPGARPDLSVDGTIELERLQDALSIGRPSLAQEKRAIRLFKLDAKGRHAHRVTVELGRSSVNRIEVVRGLQPGDRVILSDMSQWDQSERVRLE
jgi:HlyD family secretion protein